LLTPYESVLIYSKDQFIELRKKPDFKKIISNMFDNENNRNQGFGNIGIQGEDGFYSNFMKVINSSIQLSDNYSLLASLLINYVGGTTIPTLELRSSLKQTQDYKISVNAVIEKFPIIDDEISWEKILDYKEDTEVKLKLKALKNFANDLAKNQYTFSEVEDKLDYLMNEYENQIKLHKLKVKYYKYDVLLNSTIGVLENIVKLNFTEIGKSHLSLKKEKVDLLLTEKNILGNEIAYIVDSTEQFGRKKKDTNR